VKLEVHGGVPNEGGLAAPHGNNYPTRSNQSVTHITTAEGFLTEGAEDLIPMV
jgi:hypothetical protein